MIRGRYGLVIVGVVVAMLSMAAGAGYLMVYPPLPDPAVASRHDLFRWLVLRDLSKEPIATRLKIISRLETEFEKVDDVAATIGKQAAGRRQMLWHNLTVLLEPWLLGKVEEYAQLPISKRLEYIDRFLDRAEAWSKIGAACMKNQSDGKQGDVSLGKLILDQVRQGMNPMQPEKRQQIEDFMVAVEARWLWRHMPSFNLFGPASLPKTTFGVKNGTLECGN